MTASHVSAHEAFLRAEDRRRTRISLGITIGAYALSFIALWAFGLGREIEYSEYAGPVLVSLGTPEGVEVPAPEAPEAEVVADSATPSPAPTPAPSASEPALPAPVAESAKPAAARAPESPAPAPTPLVKSTESAPTGPVRGEEYGNAHETSFETSAGRVGRSLYVPIWNFMPLPKSVENRVYDRIPGDTFLSAAERKDRFRSRYEYASGAWKLKSDVPLDQRQRIWLMLEDGGYDIARADYKAERSLSDVVIRFRVGPSQGNKPPALEGAEIAQSSGYPEIDEAVLYAFRRASFSNDSAKSVTGRFTYRF